MNTVALFTTKGRGLTALAAAERFAASYWADRRFLKNASVPDDRDDCLDFQIVNGHGTWYRAIPTDDDGGWQIVMIVCP